jgi:hypothetical protein
MRSEVSSWARRGIFSFAIHYSLNGQIYVDGDTARAQWYLFMPCTVADFECFCDRARRVGFAEPVAP